METHIHCDELPKVEPPTEADIKAAVEIVKEIQAEASLSVPAVDNEIG